MYISNELTPQLLHYTIIMLHPSLQRSRVTQGQWYEKKRRTPNTRLERHTSTPHTIWKGYDNENIYFSKIIIYWHYI